VLEEYIDTAITICCWLFKNLAHYITAYLFPRDIYKIPFFPLLAPPTDTLSLKMKKLYWIENKQLIALVNTQNLSVTKIINSSSIQHAENKYDLRIQFLALVLMIHEVWLNA